MTIFYELGHFYGDECINSSSLDYLSSFPVIPDDNILSFFIDDYNCPITSLNVNKLTTLANSIYNKEVEVHFESDMVKYYDRTVNLFSSNDLVITKYQRGTVEKCELALGDYRITLSEVYPNFKPTCAMLSLTWTLYRLGLFDYETSINDVMTCIHKQYEGVEKKVQLMLSYLTKKYEIKNDIRYHYYQ